MPGPILEAPGPMMRWEPITTATLRFPISWVVGRL